MLYKILLKITLLITILFCSSCREDYKAIKSVMNDLQEVWKLSVKAGMEHGGCVVKENGSYKYLHFERKDNKEVNTLPGLRKFIHKECKNVVYEVHSHPFFEGEIITLLDNQKIILLDQDEIDSPTPYYDTKTLDDNIKGLLLTSRGVRLFDKNAKVILTIPYDKTYKRKTEDYLNRMEKRVPFRIDPSKLIRSETRNMPIMRRAS